MKTLKKILFMPLILTLLLLVMAAVPIMGMAIPAPLEKVELGTAVNFAVLAGETITNTGPTTISGSIPEGGGNVGLFPGTAFPGQADVAMTGWTAYLGDTVASVAKHDLELAYDDAAGRTPTTTFTATDNQLGGKTLKSGVYAFGHADTANLTAGEPLILDAEGNENAVFIFQASSDLITASGSEIILKNGARFCRVFWQVTSSATLGTNSHFVGHIFALTSITADTGATVQGQLLARNGSVILRSNTITNGVCKSTSESSSTSVTSTGSSSETSSSASAASSSTSATSSSASAASSSSSVTSTGTSATLSSSSTASTGSENPQTGDSIHMLLSLLALVTISAITAFVVNNKVKK